jgi:cysteine desulfuration protein SufE
MSNTNAHKIKLFLDGIQEDLSLMSDQKERLELMVELGRKLPHMPVERKVPKNKVPGCVSNVYVDVRKNNDGTLAFFGSSESFIVRGYVYILIHVLSGLKAKEVISAGPLIESFVEETGIAKSLIATRANAVGNVYRMMVEKAMR